MKGTVLPLSDFSLLLLPLGKFLILHVTMEKHHDTKLRETADSSSGHSDDVSFDEKATKRLVRKIDLVLLPLLSLLYLYAVSALFLFPN